MINALKGMKDLSDKDALYYEKLSKLAKKLQKTTGLISSILHIQSKAYFLKEVQEKVLTSLVKKCMNLQTKGQ